MKFTINLDKVQVSIPSGRVSNIFKYFNMKDVEFNNSNFLKQINSIDLSKHINKDYIFNIGKRNILEFFKRKKEENIYEFGQIYVKNIPQILNSLYIDKKELQKEIQLSVEKVKKNSEILEKINKLKKLKSVNNLS